MASKKKSPCTKGLFKKDNCKSHISKKQNVRAEASTFINSNYSNLFYTDRSKSTMTTLNNVNESTSQKYHEQPVGFKEKVTNKTTV